MGWLIVSEIWGSIEANLLSACWHGAGAGAFGCMHDSQSSKQFKLFVSFLRFFVFFEQQVLRLS